MASSKPPPGSPDYFRARAEEARDMAQRSRTTKAQDNWADIARHWEEMAEKAISFEQRDPKSGGGRA